MRFKRMAAIVGAVTLMAVVAVAGVSVASAQTATPQAQTTPSGPVSGDAFGRQGLGPGFFGGSTAEFDAEAAALNLTPTQLFEQLHSGKTLSDIATAQGVDIAKVQAAVQAVQAQSLKDRIAQAVTDGSITQAQADWLQQGLDKGYLNNGFLGFGRGGRHGGTGGLFGGRPDQAPGQAPGQAPSQAPTAPAAGTQG